MQELGEMLNGLNYSFQRVGFKMNLNKTKTIFNAYVTPGRITVGGATIEVVHNYVYLGQNIQLGKHKFEKELIFRSSISQCLKTKAFKQCVLPVMTYGVGTWTLTSGLIHILKIAQGAMEQAMLGVFLMDRIRNKVIR